jgi:predicted RNase H-like nuclease (RuvC/YqgF family)
MFGKMLKLGVVGTAGALLVGGLVFGGDLYSYVSTSARSMQTAVRDSVPIEFELQRARNMLQDIVPEMQANVRMIATQEVEIEHLRQDIQQCQVALGEERTKVAKLRDCLGQTETVQFTFSGLNYSREQVKNDLARRFDSLKEAEVVQSGKVRLLENREKSLAAAVQMLERMKTEKAMLASKIEALDAQHKLVQAAAVGSQFSIDNSKVAQTEKLIGQIKKQLDVAERVLAHESRFIEPIEVSTVNEKELLVEVNEHLGTAAQAAAEVEPEVAATR